MSRKRNPENKGLPARWRVLGNSYYYSVPEGNEGLWDGKKTFKLGNSLASAYSFWTERVGILETNDVLNQLFDKYNTEVISKKAAATQTQYRVAIENLRPVFGHFRAHQILPIHIYEFVEKRSRKTYDKKLKIWRGGKTVARIEVSVLSNVLSKAVQWGKVHRHPFKGQIRLEGEKPRTRYVEDWEIKAALSLPKMRKRGSVSLIQAYIKLKLLTGMAKGDILRLEERDLKEDGIHNTRHKTINSTNKKTVYLWIPELREVIAEIKAARPLHICPLLFCTRFGKGYYDEKTGLSTGWDSMWQRFMIRLKDETKVKNRFTDHDLRAKCASDADTLEQARQMLAHIDSKTTNRIYRRKAEQVVLSPKLPK